MNGVLYFKTLGRVCPGIVSEVNTNLCYDIPFDSLGFPILPLYKLLSSLPGFPEGIRIGFGKLPDYEGLTWAAAGISRNEQLFPKFVLGRFTEILDRGTEKYRVLRAGQIFRCRIEAPEELRSRVDKWLAGISHFGIQNEDVTGKVEMWVCWNEKAVQPVDKPIFHPELRYHRLHYALSLSVPLISFLPNRKNRMAQECVPGALVLESLKERFGSEWDAFACEGAPICANAYPSAGGRRGFPSPKCMVQPKLNKQILYYKLGLDPDQEIEEITVGMSRFITELQPAVQEVFEAEKRTVTVMGENRMALREGQVFRGFVEGTDSQIRRLAELIGDDPCFFLGFGTQEGFGEALLRVECLEPEETPCEHLMKEFDLELVSNGVFFTDEGMNDSSFTSFWQELERDFPVFLNLKVADSFFLTDQVYPVGTDGNLRDGVLRVLSSGSTFRLTSKDGRPVDVSEFDGAFIGDRNEEGYGELRVHPVSPRVIRYVQSVPQDMSSTNPKMSSSQLQHASRFIREVMDEMLRYRIGLVALNDRQQGEMASDAVLEPIFQHMKEKYDEDLDFSVMKQWYLEAADE